MKQNKNDNNTGWEANDNCIYLITTKGCEACKIMTDIVVDTCFEIPYTFSVRIKDIKDISEWIKVNVPLNDFPTLVFVKGNTIKYHISGTISADKLKQLIKDLHFD